MKFSLLLSGSCDIYDRFGIGVNLLQKVSILPHTKFDKFVSTVVKGFAQMGDTVDSQNCPCSTTPGSEDCLWPQLHKDLLEIRTRSSYHGVPVGQLVSLELSTRAGVKKTKENQLLDQAGIISRCLDNLKVYAEHLGNKLFEKVYSEADKKMIETLRVLLDLKSLSMKIKSSGAPHVASIQAKHFIDKSRLVVPSLSDVSNQEIRLQFRDFLRVLENQMDDIESEKLDSMEIFRLLLCPNLNLYINIESIVHILCTAATTMSVESVVESWVSIYESHSNKHRPISNDRAEMEVCLAVNGPLLQHADPLIKKAIKEIYKDSKDVNNRDGHFVRRNQNIADYSVSKSVDSFVKQKIQKPFFNL